MELKVKDKSKLFDETYWFLCEQHTKANPLHFVMFVGMDDELSYDMANYILGHRYQNGCLQCVDYQSETNIVEHISQMRFRTVLLLRGLEKASHIALIPIVRKIQKIVDNNDIPKPLVIEGERTSGGNPMTIPCDEFGTLIINTRDQNILPKYIREHFEVITLEPETQITASTPQKQGNGFRCIGDMWEINLKDDHLQVKDSLYMKHIQYILEHPLKKFSLLELDKVFESKQQTHITIEQQKECMDILGSSNNLGKITKQDNEDSEKYLKDRIKELGDEIEIAKDTGNSGKEVELQAELDGIVEYLSSGQYKDRISNQKGKNEESILKGINRCIESIKDASNKANKGKLIAEHIDKNIERSKYHIVYSLEDSPNWNL